MINVVFIVSVCTLHMQCDSESQRALLAARGLDASRLYPTDCGKNQINHFDTNKRRNQAANAVDQ
jgi:hypothetical protein